MPTLASFAAFLIAALALNFTPGPDMLYVMGRSIGQGKRAGVVSSLGIFAGCLAHIAIAAAGLVAILRSSPLAFNLVRYAGAGYLIYLGVNILRSRTSKLEAAAVAPDSLHRIFTQGVITNVLNPKVALFFISFLPQFVDPRHAVGLQVVVLGMIFDVGGTLVNLGVALSAGTLGEKLRANPSMLRLQQWFTASICIGLGLRLGLARR
jgi:threonine/homoserine/homoserine lactone efflux protein